MNARATMAAASDPVEQRVAAVAALDWPRIASELDAQGNAVIEALLTRAECDAVAALYAREDLFRSRPIWNHSPAFSRKQERLHFQPGDLSQHIQAEHHH